MSIISYAQNFEDVMLWRALSHVEYGFYIDIGAQDPVIDSVSLAFYEHGWRGIDVEPVQQYAELLREQRPGDMIMQAAVGDGPAVMRFFQISGTGISTASEAVAAQHRNRGFEVCEIMVPCIPLSNVLAAASAREVHWLKIDVEGFERQVLASWGSSATKPWIIVVESTVPLTQFDVHEAWEGLVIEHGYHSVYCDGLNRYYVSDDHPELKSAFLVPPNIFDDFALNGTASAPFQRRIDARYREKIGELIAQSVVQRQELDNTSARLREEEQSFRLMLEAKEQELLRRDAMHAAMQRDFDAELLALREASKVQALKYDVLREELAAVHRSLSWRTTAPLRFVGRWVRSALKAGRTADSTKLGRKLAVSFADVPASDIARHGAESESGGLDAGIGHMIDKGAIKPISQIAAGAAADLRSILRMPDVEFVHCAYWTILMREADSEGVKHYVREMRRGRPKLDVLGDLYRSSEARKMGANIPWLRSAIFRHKLARLPIVGFLIWPFLLRGKMLEMETRLEYIEETVHTLSRSSKRRGASGRGAMEGAHIFNQGDLIQDQFVSIDETDEPNLPEISKVAREILVELSEAVEEAQGRAALKRTKRDSAVRGF